MGPRVGAARWALLLFALCACARVTRADLMRTSGDGDDGVAAWEPAELSRTQPTIKGVSFLVSRGAPVSARPVGPAARRAGALRLYGVRRDHVHHGTRGPRHHGDLDRRLHRLAAAQDADLDLPPCRARARFAADGRLLSSAHHPAPVDTCPSPLGGHGLCATGRKLLIDAAPALLNPVVSTGLADGLVARHKQVVLLNNGAEKVTQEILAGTYNEKVKRAASKVQAKPPPPPGPVAAVQQSLVDDRHQSVLSMGEPPSGIMPREPCLGDHVTSTQEEVVGTLGKYATPPSRPPPPAPDYRIFGALMGTVTPPPPITQPPAAKEGTLLAMLTPFLEPSPPLPVNDRVVEALLASVDDFDAAHPKPPPPPPGMDYQMAGLNAEAMRANGETIAEVNAGLMTSKGTVPSGTTKGPTPKTCKLCFANNRPPGAPTALNVIRSTEYGDSYTHVAPGTWKLMPPSPAPPPPTVPLSDEERMKAKFTKVKENNSRKEQAEKEKEKLALEAEKKAHAPAVEVMTTDEFDRLPELAPPPPPAPAPQGFFSKLFSGLLGGAPKATDTEDSKKEKNNDKKKKDKKKKDKKKKKDTKKETTKMGDEDGDKQAPTSGGDKEATKDDEAGEAHTKKKEKTKMGEAVAGGDDGGAKGDASSKLDHADGDGDRGDTGGDGDDDEEQKKKAEKKRLKEEKKRKRKEKREREEGEDLTLKGTAANVSNWSTTLLLLAGCVIPLVAVYFIYKNFGAPTAREAWVLTPTPKNGIPPALQIPPAPMPAPTGRYSGLLPTTGGGPPQGNAAPGGYMPAGNRGVIDNFMQHAQRRTNTASQLSGLNRNRFDM